MAIDPNARSAPTQPAPAFTPKPPPPKPSAAVSFLSYLFLGTTRPGEIVVYHHSSLFYWWPVWTLGFIMAAITYFGGNRMAIVPGGTVATKASQGEAQVDGKAVDLKGRDILLLAETKSHLTRKDAAGDESIIQPRFYVSQQKSVGTVFLFVLLLVIGITNVHMRGLWSFFVLLVTVLLA